MHLLRRTFLSQTALGMGSIALSTLLDRDAPAHAAGPAPGGLPVGPHFPPRVKRVIFLYMSGGPSQFETFDHKPKLNELDGQPMPESYTQGQPIAQLQGQQLKVLGGQFPFAKHGQSGQEIASLLPWTSRLADDLAIIRSMHTDQINHDPAHTVMNTGTSISGRPSMGAWITYGLGSESSNLPGFVVLTSEGGRNPQPISSRQWGAGFLPGRVQGVQFQQQGEAVHYAQNPPGLTPCAGSMPNSCSVPPIPNSKRASTSTNSPSACRPASRNCSIWRRNPATCWSLTGWTMILCGRRASPATACWRGGWPNGVCASSNSITGDGIITATW
jgi:hypothetical protein